MQISDDHNIGLLTERLKHGGNLSTAIEQYGIAEQHWLDLSTGISPWSWPVSKLPDYVWQQLPPNDHKLLNAAAKYYQCDNQYITVSPGSQISIRLLPQLLASSSDKNLKRIAIPMLGYKEHAHSWQLADFTLVLYENQCALKKLIEQQQVDHVVIINPNNPSTEFIDHQSILTMSQQLNGIMLVDEAFIDTTPEQSVAEYVSGDVKYSNLIVLRSLGKFFGLAGLRIGFVLSQNPLCQQLAALLQPWSINHAAMHIATNALSDIIWQQQQQQRIAQQNQQLQVLLKTVCNHYVTGVDCNQSLLNGKLFFTLLGDKKALNALHQNLAQQAVWTRLSDATDAQSWLRLSLPGEEFESLQAALKKVLHKPQL